MCAIVATKCYIGFVSVEDEDIDGNDDLSIVFGGNDTVIRVFRIELSLQMEYIAMQTP